MDTKNDVASPKKDDVIAFVRQTRKPKLHLLRRSQRMNQDVGGGSTAMQGKGRQEVAWGESKNKCGNGGAGPSICEEV